MKTYSVKKLAKLAGVSVRTLHHYDKIGLLKPSVRTEARYRLYSEPELLRLQQILFYKELDLPLQEIADILDNPGFDTISALESHRIALLARQQRLDILLHTIDNTISKLKKRTMLNHEELYEGLSKETAEAYRQEAIEKYGEEVERSENYLRQLGKEDFAKLKVQSEAISRQLASMIQDDPTSAAVQEQIAKHYTIIRTFWGTLGSADTQAEAYSGLGELYVQDERYTMVDGKPQPEFATFMSKAMKHFAETQLK